MIVVCGAVDVVYGTMANIGRRDGVAVGNADELAGSLIREYVPASRSASAPALHSLARHEALHGCSRL